MHRLSGQIVDRRAVLIGLGVSGAAAALLACEPMRPARAAPGYVPPVGVNDFDAALGVYNWTAGNTRRHRAGLLRAAGGGQAAEVFVGDSLTAGCVGGSTFDRLHAWPRCYAATLAELGVPSAGTGVVRAADLTTTDARWQFSGAWHGLYTCGYTEQAGASATFTSDVAGTNVAVIVERGPAAGAFTISVDGAVAGTGFRAVRGGGAEQVGRIVLSGLDDTVHSVTVTAMTGGPVLLVGVEVFGMHGLSCHNVAQSGSRASGTGAISWSETGSVLRLLTLYGGTSATYGVAPSAVHCALGINDVAAGADAQTILAALATIRAAAPGCDFFLHLQPQPAEIEPEVWFGYAAALYGLADSLDVPLFDLQYLLGGYQQERADGLTGDAVAHLNAAGYARWGRAVGTAAAP